MPILEMKPQPPPHFLRYQPQTFSILNLQLLERYFLTLGILKSVGGGEISTQRWIIYDFILLVMKPQPPPQFLRY